MTTTADVRALVVLSKKALPVDSEMSNVMPVDNSNSIKILFRERKRRGGGGGGGGGGNKQLTQTLTTTAWPATAIVRGT